MALVGRVGAGREVIQLEGADHLTRGALSVMKMDHGCNKIPGLALVACSLVDTCGLDPDLQSYGEHGPEDGRLHQAQKREIEMLGLATVWTSAMDGYWEPYN